MVEDAPGLLSPKVHDHLLALLRPELDAPALVRVVAVVVVAVLLLFLHYNLSFFRVPTVALPSEAFAFVLEPTFFL